MAASLSHASERVERPNILWIVVDDMSANFSCYGETLIQTPAVDELANQGVRFRRAFVTAPVCSPCRSALITGCYQTTISAHHHRSGRGRLKITLPGDVVPIPVLFQQAGYYTCIGGHEARGNALGKTDYNFEWDPNMYDGNDWSGRGAGQPFFMQVQLHGGKLRGNQPNRNWQNRVARELGSNPNPDKVTLPPYYPRDPVILQDWADYLDCCRYTDKQVGDVIARLKSENLLDETVVFFITDHGISHARGKQFLYDEGIHIPLVVRGPGIEETHCAMIWSSILTWRPRRWHWRASKFPTGCRVATCSPRIMSVATRFFQRATAAMRRWIGFAACEPRSSNTYATTCPNGLTFSGTATRTGRRS